METTTLRQALLTRLGYFPERVPLNAKLGSKIDEGTCTRTLVTYDVEAGERVSAWLLMPQREASPGGWPAVLIFCALRIGDQLLRSVKLTAHLMMLAMNASSLLDACLLAPACRRSISTISRVPWTCSPPLQKSTRNVWERLGTR